jgi:IS5 family transposase
VPAEVIATVMVLQALEGLSDREAISALRRDIAWKVACGLRLDDEAFHPTVLVYWRNRLRASDRPRRIFEAVRQVVAATGVLGGMGRRVLDSTILEDSVATQDTVTQLVAAIRRVRGWSQRPARSRWWPTTMSGRANPSAPGMTSRPSRRWCRSW